MKISEIFGFGVDNHSTKAWEGRENKRCPFRDHSPCTKVSKVNPLGICSFSDGDHAAAVCPVRLLEGGRVFRDAGRLAFGEGVQIGIFPEVRILKTASNDGQRGKKIGKVDFLLGKVDDGEVVDFAAVEVQAAYISGGSVRPAFDEYIEHQGRSNVLTQTERRTDFRSSAQKRLMPQIQLKLPVFRRWAKKFFVVVDSRFFKALPDFPHTSRSNSEITWLVYPIKLDPSSDNYTMEAPQEIFSEWDDVANALREGKPPKPSEILKELQCKLENKPPRQRWRAPLVLIT